VAVRKPRLQPRFNEKKKQNKKKREGEMNIFASSKAQTGTSSELATHGSFLNGVGDINVQTLISYTSFNDESGMYIRGLDLGSCGGGRGGTSWAYVVFIMSVGTSHLGGPHL
jgi:hypothetical protein